MYTDYLNSTPVVLTHWRSQCFQATLDLTGPVICSNVYILSRPSLAPDAFTPPFVPTSTRANRLLSCSLLREAKALVTTLLHSTITSNQEAHWDVLRMPQGMLLIKISLAIPIRIGFYYVHEKKLAMVSPVMNMTFTQTDRRRSQLSIEPTSSRIGCMDQELSQL
jgi:hypothetical protein